MWGGWRYARRGRMVAGTGGACGERWEKREDEMREPGAWAWAGPQMAWSVEKALESQPQGWGHACRGGGGGTVFRGRPATRLRCPLRPWWTIPRTCPWTLATKRSWPFGKPRSGRLGLALGKYPPKLQTHSFTFTHSFIHSECIEHLMFARHGLGTHPGQIRQGPCPPGACSGSGRGLD